MIRGFRFAGVHAGIKKDGALDLGVIVADHPAACAGVFTQNRVVAAPVVLSRASLEATGLARAVVVNSGNANACTGERGMADAKRMALLVAEQLSEAPERVQVGSTGVIGAPLPMGALERAIPKALEAAHEAGLPEFARAIMTTDTRPKLRSATVELAERTITIAGVCKGAGMIHPDMATMLAYLMTDAPIGPAELDAVWRRVCAQSFNAITVDGDTSTNDTALLLASGAAGGDPLIGAELQHVEDAIGIVARELAFDILRDAEGSTKVVHLTVLGAPDPAAARVVAQAIALSPLVKTAVHGEDPNWGRIIAAAGRTSVDIDPARMVLHVGEVELYAEGQWRGPDAEAAAHQVMATGEYPVRLDLGLGHATCTLSTCDFSADYIRINADYRS